MENRPVSVFDFRTFAPNTPIVNEGEFEDSVYIVKSGNLRAVKLIKFYIVKLADGTTDLVPLPEHKQKFSHQTPNSIYEEDGKKIVVKLLQIAKFGEGDYFGNFRGTISFSNEDEAEHQHERERRMYSLIILMRRARSISNITVITSTRCEVLIYF
jgi:CRP-like cAMP-binding protein